MTEDDKKKALATYRLQQALESLEEARYLFGGEKSLRSVVNRLYYGMFYAVLALLIYEPFASSKHSGVHNPSMIRGIEEPAGKARRMNRESRDGLR